jgi:hypothetical protein
VGIDAPNGKLMPDAPFGPYFNSKSILILLMEAFVGFGTRYAGGCTSGHAISGLSNLQIIIKGRYRILYRRIDYGLFIIPLNFLKYK